MVPLHSVWNDDLENIYVILVFFCLFVYFLFCFLMQTRVILFKVPLSIRAYSVSLQKYAPKRDAN